MAFELFKLFGSIMIDNEKANESISKTEKKAQSLGDKLGKGVVTAGKWGLAIGAGAAAAGGALLGVASKSADATDRIDKMSQKLGMSKQGFQEWDYILGQNGISIDSLGGGMKALTNLTDELSKGTKGAVDSFGRLGISYDDLKGKTQEEIFDITVKKLMEVEDVTQRAALANDLLGRSGAELAPLLNQGAEGAEELRKRAQELGLVLSDDAVDAGVVFGDTMDDLKSSMAAATAQIGVELMPMFQKFMDWVLVNMPEIKAFMSEAFRVIGEAVQVVWGIFSNYLLPVFESILGWVQDNWPLISSIIKTAFTVVKTVWDIILQPVLKALLSIFGDVFKWVDENFPTIQKTIETVFGAIGDVVDGVVDVFKSLVGWIEDALDAWNKWRNRPDEEKQKTSTSNFGGITGGVKSYIGATPHANGLEYVPYDGYVASLHKGERVLTAKENQTLASDIGNQIVDALVSAGLTKPANIILDGKKVGSGIISVVDDKLNKRLTAQLAGRGAI